MQEEVESRVAVIMTNCTKLTASTLAKALGKVLAGAKQKHDVKTARKAAEKANGPHGQMTVKELAAKDRGMQSIEVNDKNIGAFSRVARKYGIDFAPFKVKGVDKFIPVLVKKAVKGFEPSRKWAVKWFPDVELEEPVE